MWTVWMTWWFFWLQIEPNERPLHEKLNANKIAEQEALINQRAFKNQIQGLNEDEAAYLGVLSY